MMSKRFEEFRKASDPNPLPADAIKCHQDLWDHISHMDIRAALTDNRVLFMLRYMFPPIYALLFLILGAIVAAAIAIIMSGNS